MVLVIPLLTHGAQVTPHDSARSSPVKIRALLPLGSAIAATGLLAAGMAAPAQAAKPKFAIGAKMAKASGAKDIVKFWTADGGAHFKAAKSASVDWKHVPKIVSTGGPSADGRPTVIPAIGAEKKAAGKSKNLNLPKTTGVIFFVGRDGQEYFCSGTSIQSKYHNVVATAGHCAYDTDHDSNNLDAWVFVPGFYDGKAPWGVYVGKQAFVHYDFNVYEDYDRDYAFVTVYNGLKWDWSKDRAVDVGRLGDNVGGQGFAYNLPLGQKVLSIGYPGGPHPDGDRPFSGWRPKWCYGTTSGRVVAKEFKVSEQIAIKCSMTQGASGGPWLLKYKSASRLGYISGVTSLVADFDGNDRIDANTSPYFDGETAAVYKAAAAVWSGKLPL
ncbi:trypsin-like peptidase domain-containing protein [Streptosporangiaceae bacterium NEAU-GS5]|nr:trypsin-like peptidase domain-containing protein [Streptosporangiaceae bacterium NEAU-GS5]